MAPGEHSSPAYAQAASLARTLWLSVPDEELVKLASNPDSQVFSDETLRAQISRMLTDKRSDRMIKSFCDQWLNLGSWDKVSPSLKLYPTYDDLLHHYLPLETQAYLAYLIRENMPVGQLIDFGLLVPESAARAALRCRRRCRAGAAESIVRPRSAAWRIIDDG